MGSRVTSDREKSKELRSKHQRRSVSTRQNEAVASSVGLLASPHRRTLLAGLILLAVTVILYSPVIHYPFVNYDDDIYVRYNPHVNSGLSWDTARWAFTSFDASNWHPLTWLSHALDCQIFELNPGGHHATNLLLHVLNVLLLFWVLRKATGYIGRSAMVAALFALHPINVESVAWIAERKNLLSMLFFLLALGAYRWYVREPRSGRYIVVALLFAFGLMAKPQIITFPFVLLLWDYWPLRRMFPSGDELRSASETEIIPPRSFRWLVMEKLPLITLSAISAVITVKAQRAAGAMGGINWHPFAVRLENAVVAYMRYLEKAFWPTRLAPLYPHPGDSLRGLQVATASLLLIAITAAVIAGRRHRYLLTGWLWFLGTLVPMIGLMQVGVQAMADRYAYLPFVGLFIAITWGVAELAGQQQLPAKWLPATGGVVLLILVVLTHQQLGYWKNNVTLWSHTLQVTSGNWVAENNLGHALLEDDKEEQAFPHFQAALAINPSHADSNLSVGAYEQGHGELQQAIQQYEKVLSITQSTPGLDVASREKAFSNMGLAYRDLHDYGRARASFEEAVELNPRDASAWIGVGTMAEKTGDLKLAVNAYSEAARVHPTDVGYLLLARASRLGGDESGARRATERAQALTQNFAEAQRTAEQMVGP